MTADVMSVSVTLLADGEMGRTDDMWRDPIQAVKVEWRAHGGPRGIVVSVTAYSAGRQNKTWMDPRFFVADGLNGSEPPAWVPAAPAWFWTAVAEMRGAA